MNIKTIALICGMTLIAGCESPEPVEVSVPKEELTLCESVGALLSNPFATPG